MARKKINRYKNINQTSDRQLLYDNLSQENLLMIDDVLDAYFSGRIDLKIPRFENGDVDFCGEFELIKKDFSYPEYGSEILILKWVEDFEDTGYLIECLE